MKLCKMCTTEYQETGPAQRYCPHCQVVRAAEVKLQRKAYAERKRRARGAKVGRGAPAGAAHPNYKHGWYVAQTQARQILEERRECERCSTNLIGVSKWHWVMHHRDHNHANHAEENLELLCKSCHQMEHNCINNLKV